MELIRILIADDHTLIRAGIRALLEKIDTVGSIKEAANGQEALELLRESELDVVLTDIAMPVLNGLQLTEQISREFPTIKTIIVSMHSTEEYVCQALKSGAVGYLLKDSGPAELRMAIDAVARGESYLSPAVSRHVISDYIKRTTSPTARMQDSLTPRQREILGLIVESGSTKAIARRLNISVKTVETHRAQLMERLDIHDVAGLVRYAIRNGLATLDNE
jgi:DNA-binding NarL/FixJ family response regulator